MILPLGDSPNPRGLPLVNYALIAINVAVYVLVTLPLSSQPPDPADPLLQEYVELLQRQFGGSIGVGELLASLSSYDLFVLRHGYRPAEGSVVTLFTSMFLHGGFLHLAGNMLFLWIYGDNVEHRLGKLGYLVAYLGCGVAATLAHAVFDLDSRTPMVGASGAISGALGFYFLFFPRNRVKLLVAFFPFLVDVVMVPARLVLGFYLIVDNLLPFLATRGMEGGGVAYGAHIGGFVAGLAVAFVLDRRERSGTPREYRRAHAPADEASVRGLVESGRHAEAAQAYFADRGERAVPAATLLELADWLDANGHPTAALSVYRRVIVDQPSGSLAARAHLGAGEVQLRALDRPVSAFQHFLDAIDLDEVGRVAEIARARLGEIEAAERIRGRGR